MHQYVPTKVVGSWTTPAGTVDIMDGTVRGEVFADASKNADRWTLETDNAGNATRVKNEDRTGGLAVTFSGSSPTNKKLWQLAQTDDQLENIVGVLKLRDLSGESEVVMTGAFLVGIPPFSAGNTRGVKVWRWMCQREDTKQAGHNTVG